MLEAATSTNISTELRSHQCFDRIKRRCDDLRSEHNISHVSCCIDQIVLQVHANYRSNRSAIINEMLVLATMSFRCLRCRILQAFRTHLDRVKLKEPKSEAFRVMIDVLNNKLRSKLLAMSDVFQMRIQKTIVLEVASLNRMCERTEAVANHAFSY